MSPKTKGRVHLVYGICLSVLIVAVGVLFALSCLSIYRSGSSPFTRESIATHFGRIAIPTYLCVAGVLGGMVLSLALPLEGGKIKSRRDAGATLAKLSARLDLSACDAAIAAAIRRERTLRRVTVAVLCSLAGVAMLPALVWCVNPAHFSIADLNTDVKTAAAFILPCAAVALGLLVAAVLLRGASVARETAAVKAALAAGKGTNASADGKGKTDKKNLTSDPRFVWGLRGVIFAAGVVFIVWGVLNGGMADVLGKAIRICTECIGLG